MLQNMFIGSVTHGNWWGVKKPVFGRAFLLGRFAHFQVTPVQKLSNSVRLIADILFASPSEANHLPAAAGASLRVSSSVADIRLTIFMPDPRA